MILVATTIYLQGRRMHFSQQNCLTRTVRRSGDDVGKITGGKDEKQLMENIPPELLLRQNTDGDTCRHQTNKY